MSELIELVDSYFNTNVLPVQGISDHADIKCKSYKISFQQLIIAKKRSYRH